MPLLDQSAAVAALESLGMRVESITLVSQRPGGGREVYRAEVDTGTDGRVVFVKGYPSEVRETIETVVSASADVGLPESDVVADDGTVLVSEQAPGRPLSWVFPLVLLPGVWRVMDERVETAVDNLGRYLGRLHGLEPEREPSLREGLRGEPDYLSVPESVRDTYPKPKTGRMEALFDSARRVPCTSGICHADPSPHNVYYADGDVRLIDYVFRQRPVATDRVLAELGIELMVNRLPYGRESQLETLRSAFRSGYQAAGFEDEIDESALEAIKLGMCLRLLDRHTADPKTVRARITRWTDRSILKRLIDEILSARATGQQT